jgi:hypothetical protein
MTVNEPFLRWHTEATAILDSLEQLADRAAPSARLRHRAI